MKQITMDDVHSVFVAEEGRKVVQKTLDATIKDPAMLLRVLSRYATLNAAFGSCVASLAGRIGRSKDLFKDKSQPIDLFADRSVFVASFVFDAARDEFDDRDNPGRDTHRCLAQSFLMGILSHYSVFDEAHSDDASINKILQTPDWLNAVTWKVAKSYGVNDSDAPHSSKEIFFGLGYHLGSEIFAIQEFTMIDNHIRQNFPDLYKSLQEKMIEIEGVKHNAYSWVRIHSGGGKDVEQDHFDAALIGVNHALRLFVSYGSFDEREAVIDGMKEFAHHHKVFFETVTFDKDFE